MVDMVLHMYLALIHDYSCYAHALQLNMTLLQHTKLMQTQFKTIQDYSRLLHNSRQFKTIQDSYTIQDNSRLFKTYTHFKTIQGNSRLTHNSRPIIHVIFAARVFCRVLNLSCSCLYVLPLRRPMRSGWLARAQFDPVLCPVCD